MKRPYISLLFILAAIPLRGQTVVVQGVVADNTGKVYQNGSGVVNLQPNPMSCFVNGTNPVTSPVPIAQLDSFGHFSVSLTNTSLISCAGGASAQWQFSFSSNPALTGGSAISFTMTPMPLTTSQDISAQITAQAALLPSTGGGTPGGTNTYVQFNNAGAFGGSANFTWNSGTNTLGIIGNGIFSGPLSVTGPLTTNMTGGPFCVHEIAGILSAVATDCGSGGGGTGNVNTNPTGSQAIVQPIVAGNPTNFTTNYANSIAYVVSSYNWSQTDVAGSIGNLGTPGSNTLTLTPCPAGIDNSGSTNAPYGVYISGVGTPEAVPVAAGGSCTSGAASGTIIVTTANVHNPGFTISSATGGNQEAINVADGGNAAQGASGGFPLAVIQELPAGQVTANYNIYWPVFLNSGKTKIIGDGAFWQCYTRSVCLMVGNYAASTSGHNVVQGLAFQSAVNIDGAHIANVTAASGTYTVNTSTNHNLLPGDYAILYYSTPAQTQEARVLVASTPTTTQFTYSLGAATFALSAGYGWVAAETAAVEVETDGTSLLDIKLGPTTVSGARFNQGIVVGNDQSFTWDRGAVLNSNAIRCGANFCGNALYLRGDQGAAPVAYIHHVEMSMQCGGNGIRNVAGNTLDVQDSVIQGQAQYGIYYGGGLQPMQTSNVYQEPGNCSNPFYPGSLGAQAGLIAKGTNSLVTQTGNSPSGGGLPIFVTGGGTSTQRNYYIVSNDTGLGGSGSMLYIGSALPVNGAVSIPIYWPNPELNGSGTRTFDVLVTIGVTQTAAPYTGNAFSLATGIGGACNTSGICTYTDTQGSTTAYTVQNPSWSPTLQFWPGAYVLSNGASLYMDTCGQASSIVVTSYLPKVFCKRSVVAGQTFSYTPYWGVSMSGDSSLSGNKNVGAQAIQVGPAAGAMASGITGGVIFSAGQGASLAPRQLLTLFDGTPQQTFATPGYVRTGSVKDNFIGTDTPSGAVGTQDQTYGSPGGHFFYVNDVGTSGTSWLEGLTSTLKTIKVKIAATEPLGSVWGSATGGSQGPGTINAVGLFVNGNPVTGGLSGMTPLGIPIPNSATSINSTTTPGSNQGVYVAGRVNTVQGTATTTTETQVGDCSNAGAIAGATSTYTVVYTDVIGCVVRHDRAGSAAVTVTIPTPTTLNNANPIFVYENDSTSVDVLTPTTFTISLGNAAAAATLNVPGNVVCLVNLDRTNASTWKANCHLIATTNPPAPTITAWWSPASTGNNAMGATTQNTTRIWAFYLPTAITSSAGICYQVQTADNTADVYDVGLYSSAGTLLVHTGALAGTTLFAAGGPKCVNWASSAAIPIDNYAIALTSSAASPTAQFGGATAASIANLWSAGSATGGGTSGGALNGSITFPTTTWAGNTMVNFSLH